MRLSMVQHDCIDHPNQQVLLGGKNLAKIYEYLEVSDASVSSSTFGSQVSELTMYLDSDPITIFDDNFDILCW